MKNRTPPNKKPIIPEHNELDVFTPSEEALICLKCPLPKCNRLVCKRFNEEKKKLKEAKKL